MIGAGILAILIFSVARIVAQPQSAKSVLGGIVALLVLFGLSYAFSTGDDANGIFTKLEVSEGTSHMVGTGLITFYLLVGLAILSILYVELTRLFK